MPAGVVALRPSKTQTIEVYSEAALLVQATVELVTAVEAGASFFALREHIDSLESDWERFAKLARNLIDRTV